MKLKPDIKMVQRRATRQIFHDFRITTSASDLVSKTCVLEQFKHADSKEIACAVLVPLGGAYSSRHICSSDITLFTSTRRI